MPRSGQILLVGRTASVQFATPIWFRVIVVHEEWTRRTYDGWIWLDGYELDREGHAVVRRSIFVQTAGLRYLPTEPARHRGYQQAGQRR